MIYYKFQDDDMIYYKFQDDSMIYYKFQDENIVLNYAVFEEFCNDYQVDNIFTWVLKLNKFIQNVLVALYFQTQIVLT